MGLEAVLEKIKEAGEAECNELINEARKKAEEIRQKAKAETEALEKKNADSVAAEIERLTTRELSSAEIEARKLVLNTQRDILEKVRASVLENLGKLPADRREAIFKILLGQAHKDLPEGTVRCASGDKEIIKRNSKYSGGEPIDTVGGFIVTTADGSLTLDLRLENLLEDFWNKRLRKITEQLFSEK
ncbi:MAG: V-type ATP synthase subunit E family protein [Planctomycetota bacterium]|jgi:V/A-type H+-transporting ATPase subunit E